jgi:hypothetical protein
MTLLVTTLVAGGGWSVSNTSPAGTQFPSGTTNPSGSYQVFARAYDKASNSLLSAVNIFLVATATAAPQEAASSVTLSSISAQASGGTVRLVFSGALEAAKAGDPSRYSVSLNSASVAVESVQVASSTTVVLGLEEGGITIGDTATVSYRIADSKGRVLEGVAKVTAK